MGIPDLNHKLKNFRLRGAIIAVLGLPTLVVALIALIDYRFYHILFSLVGGVSMVGGLLLFAHDNYGNNRFVSKKRGPASTRSIDALRQDCETQTYPYTLCLYHRKVVVDSLYADADDDKWQEDECALCNPLLDYMEIATEEDLNLALTSLDNNR